MNEDVDGYVMIFLSIKSEGGCSRMKRLVSLVLVLLTVVMFSAAAYNLQTGFIHPEIGELIIVTYQNHMPKFDIYGFTYYELPDPGLPYRGMAVNQLDFDSDQMLTLEESLNFLLDSVEGKTAEPMPVAFTYTGVMEQYSDQLNALPREQKVAAIKKLNGFEGREGYSSLNDIPGFEQEDFSTLSDSYFEFSAKAGDQRYPYRVLQFHVEEEVFEEYYYERYCYININGEWRLIRVAKEYADDYENRQYYIHGVTGFDAETVYDINYELMREFMWGVPADEVAGQESLKPNGELLKVQETSIYQIPCSLTYTFTDDKLTGIAYEMRNQQSFFSAFVSLYMRYADPVTINENGDMTWSLNNSHIVLTYDELTPTLTISHE